MPRVTSKKGIKNCLKIYSFVNVLFSIWEERLPIIVAGIKLINAKIIPLPRYTLKAFQEKGMNFMDLSVSKGNNTGAHGFLISNFTFFNSTYSVVK